MKKLSVLFAAVMMLVTAGAVNAQKVASMDYEAVLAAMPETKKMTTDFLKNERISLLLML